jgi:hypothetical protein
MVSSSVPKVRDQRRNGSATSKGRKMAIGNRGGPLAPGFVGSHRPRQSSR